MLYSNSSQRVRQAAPRGLRQGSSLPVRVQDHATYPSIMLPQVLFCLHLIVSFFSYPDAWRLVLVAYAETDHRKRSAGFHAWRPGVGPSVEKGTGFYSSYNPSESAGSQQSVRLSLCDWAQGRFRRMCTPCCSGLAVSSGCATQVRCPTLAIGNR